MVLRIYTQGGLPETASSRSHAAPKKKTRTVAQAAAPSDKN